MSSADNLHLLQDFVSMNSQGSGDRVDAQACQNLSADLCVTVDGTPL